MSGRLVLRALLLLGIAAAEQLMAKPASFTGIGDLPGAMDFSGANGISGDGTTVVGWGRGPTYAEAIRWTRDGGIVSVAGGIPSDAYAASYDGSVVVGYVPTYRAFRWTADGGMAFLEKPTEPIYRSFAFGVSASGSMVVGARQTASGGLYTPFRWTLESGMTGLGDLPGGEVQGGASGISADGSVIVGYSYSANGQEAFRWTAAGGMVGLGDLPGGEFASSAVDVSGDGSVVVGFGTSASGMEAFRKVGDGPMIGLGDLPGQGFRSVADAVSADGSIVVGEGQGSTGERAFIWDEVNGMRDLRGVLEALGVGAAMEGWQVLSATGISDDGQTIAGRGINPAGNAEGWVATIPEPGMLLILACGLMVVGFGRCRGRRDQRAGNDDHPHQKREGWERGAELRARGWIDCLSEAECKAGGLFCEA